MNDHNEIASAAAPDAGSLACASRHPVGACAAPPEGWYCTREAGHAGPCAAHAADPLGLTAASADPIVEMNVDLLRKRSAVGVVKYGVTMAASKLPLRAWLVHALEESLDHANYLQAAIQTIDAAGPVQHHKAIIGADSIPYGAVSELAAFQYWAANQTEPLNPISAWCARAALAGSAAERPAPVAVAGGGPVYENGPSEMQRVRRMPTAVLECIIDYSLFRNLAHRYEGEDRDRLHGLMHDVAEETLARVSFQDEKGIA